MLDYVTIERFADRVIDYVSFANIHINFNNHNFFSVFFIISVYTNKNKAKGDIPLALFLSLRPPFRGHLII